MLPTFMVRGIPSLCWLSLPVVAYMAVVFSSYTNITLLIIDLERKLRCGSVDDDDDCDEDKVSSSAAMICSYVFLVESVCSIAVVGFFGILSDHIGRVPMICVSFLGIVLENFGILLVMRLNLPVIWLCFPAAVQGLCGSYSGFLCVASAYVSDVYGGNGEDTRTESFSNFEILLNIGGILGPFIGGWILSSYGFDSYFVICILFSLCILLYLRLMPESMAKNSKKWDGKWFMQSTIGTMRLLIETRPNLAVGDVKSVEEGSPPSAPTSIRLYLISVAFFFTFGNTVSASGIYVLFTSREFDWGSFTVGVFLSTSALIGVLALLTFRRTLRHFIQISDILMAKIGAISSGAYFMLFAILRSPVACFVCLPLLAVQTASTPCYRCLFSSCFPAEQQGQIFAAVSALEALSGMVCPLLFMFVYSSVVVHGLAALIFVMLAVVAMVAFAALSFAQIPTPMAPSPVSENGSCQESTETGYLRLLTD